MFVLSADGANSLVKKKGRLFPLLAERECSLPDVAWDETQTLESVQGHLEARVEDPAYLIDHLLARPSPESSLNRFQPAAAGVRVSATYMAASQCAGFRSHRIIQSNPIPSLSLRSSRRSHATFPAV